MADHRLRLGMVSAAHLHARGLMRDALECPEADVVGLAEPNDELRNYFSQLYPGLTVFRSAAELYDVAHPEAIITCADNRTGADIVIDAARRGMHVMKEKPMAADLTLAEKMSVAAARGGIRLMINWPTMWMPSLHEAKRLVDAGAVGRVWQTHFRNGHGGPPADFQERQPGERVGWGWLIERETNGGGAYVDFCSYGAALSRWIMGPPSRVMSLGGRYAKDFFSVEDNAILVLGYERGHSVCEGTWTQPGRLSRVPQIVIYGTEGTIALTGNTEIQIATTSDRPGEPRTITCEPLPAEAKNGPSYFAHRILNGEPFEGLTDLEINRDAQEILEAGRIAMAQGREIGLPLKSFLQG